MLTLTKVPQQGLSRLQLHLSYKKSYTHSRPKGIAFPTDLEEGWATETSSRKKENFTKEGIGLGQDRELPVN